MKSIQKFSFSQFNKANFIPVIDFEKFLKGNEKDKKQVGKEVLNAFQTCGFMYLKNHGVQDSRINNIFQNSKNFFDQSKEYKLQLEWESPESNRGYSAMGREKLSEKDKEGKADEIKQLHETQPDQKESFEIGNNRSGQKYRNLFPDLQNFKNDTLEYFDTMHTLNLKLMECISVGLDLDSQYLPKLCSKADNTLRLLHYPAVEKSKLEVAQRAGAHCDYGTITILFQDNNGGLQVKNLQTGEFQDAIPIEGTCIINAGDMLQRISNDTFKSTLHQVVQPPVKVNSNMYPARYSVVYFCNANFDSDLECIPNCYSAQNPKKYEKVNAFDYLVSRLSATYF